MKRISPIILVFLLLSGCSSIQTLSEEQIRARTVDIMSSQVGWVHGKWVILETGKVLTSRHVVENCSSGCFIEIQKQKYPIVLLDFPDENKDVAYVSFSGYLDLEKISPVDQKNLPLWSMLVSYRFSSSSWQRLEGKILWIDTPYIGYDMSLSGVILSGAVVTNIVLSPGESGTPIWTLSGELVGVMSAVDREGKRSYIVQ